jgi:hypothetical protein
MHEAPVTGGAMLRELLWASETLYAAVLGPDGAIAEANAALARAAGRDMAGERFTTLLAGPQSGAFDAALDRAGHGWTTLTVGFHDPDGGPAEDRRVHLHRAGAEALVVAEPAVGERDRLVEQVLALNDDLIGSQRALGRRQRELEQARAAAEAALARVRALEAITLAGVSTASLDDVLKTLLGVAREVLGSDRAAALLLEDDGALVVRAAVGFGGDPHLGRRVAPGDALLAERRHLVADELDAETAARTPIGFEGGSLAAVVLELDGRLLGGLHVSAATPRRFDEQALRLLQVVGERTAVAIGQAQLRDRERQISATLQRTLLPSRLAAPPGVAVAARYVPRAFDVNVGGDFYDAFAVGDGAVGLLIGDVAGKGLPAAAAMGHLRSAARAWSFDDPNPGEMLTRLDRLAAVDEAVMATALYARLDPATGDLQYASAGHPPLLTTRHGEAAFLDGARSPVLGLRFGPRPTAQATLQPGGLLLLYTDGLVERRSASLDGMLERLRETAAVAPADPEALCETLLHALGDDGPFADDVALLAARQG